MTRDDYTGPTAAPRTPAQRDAVARLIEHGAVYVSGRGERRGPAHVTGVMSSWLQRNGWADWDYSDRGLPLLMVITRSPGVSGERAIRPTLNAYQCGGCGRFWREPTPAGRCPWEVLHLAE